MILLVIRKSDGAVWLAALGEEGVSAGVRTCLSLRWGRAESGLKRPRGGAEENELGEGGRVQVSRQILLEVELNSSRILPREMVWASACLNSQTSQKLSVA